MCPLRILYVDDEPDLREIVAFALGLDPDLAIQVCADGAEAIAQAACWRPHLILLDVMMPGMDGPETLAAIRATPGCEQMPAVFITARTQSAEVQSLMKPGVLGVIAKPFDPFELVRQVRSFLHDSTS